MVQGLEVFVLWFGGSGGFQPHEEPGATRAAYCWGPVVGGGAFGCPARSWLRSVARSRASHAVGRPPSSSVLVTGARLGSVSPVENTAAGALLPFWGSDHVLDTFRVCLKHCQQPCVVGAVFATPAAPLGRVRHRDGVTCLGSRGV